MNDLVGAINTEAAFKENNTLNRSFDQLQIFKYKDFKNNVDLDSNNALSLRKITFEELTLHSILALTSAKT